MAQPTPYEREFNFSNQQAATPTTPIPAPHLDAELNRVKLTLDQTLANLALIQSDEGLIAENIVDYAQLTQNVRDDLLNGTATIGTFEATMTGLLSDAPEATDEIGSVIAMQGANFVKATNIARFFKYDVTSGKYGAVADYNAGNPTASTDNTEAFQEAIDAAIATGGTVFVPAGKYYFAQGSAPLNPGIGGFSIVGEYGASQLYFHEGTDVAMRHLFRETNKTAGKTFVHFKDIDIIGTFQLTRFTRQGGSGVYMDHYKELRFTRVRFMNLSQMATDLHFNKGTSFDGCLFQDVSRDGARMRESFWGTVSGCRFVRVGDDNVAWHGGKYVAVYDPDDGSPRQEGFIAYGNFFSDGSNPFSCIGGRKVDIHHNMAFRTGGHGFAYIVNDTDEGSHPLGHVNVSDNLIFDQYHEDAVIYVRSETAPRGTAASTNIIPGMYHSDGTLEPLWSWNNVDLNDAADPWPPTPNIVVSRNIIARTLPAVAAYSDWGFGLPATNAGVDFAVTDAMLRPPAGINVDASQGVLIQDNIIAHTDQPIYLVAQDNMLPAVLHAKVSGNLLFDFTASGVGATNVTSSHMLDLTINDNIINGDIRRESANSNADGTYDSGTNFPRAFDFGSAFGAKVSDNRISNVAVPMLNIGNHVCNDNLLVVDLVALGDDASNKGIRNVPNVGLGFDYVIAYCDPTDNTNYGKIKNVLEKARGSKPSAGVYPNGWVLKNTSPAVSGSGGSQYILYGWMKIGTDSTHTGSGWSELRTLTGT